MRRTITVLVATLCACAPTAKKSAAPNDAADPLADAESRLVDNASRMRALGIPLGARDENERRSKDDARPSGEEVNAPTKPGATDAPPAVSPPPPEPPPTAEVETGATAAATNRTDDRCTQICELAQVACGLQEQICRLAETHVGEPRYEDACWRARDQCDQGSDACDECSAC